MEKYFNIISWCPVRNEFSSSERCSCALTVHLLVTGFRERLLCRCFFFFKLFYLSRPNDNETLGRRGLADCFQLFEMKSSWRQLAHKPKKSWHFWWNEKSEETSDFCSPPASRTVTLTKAGKSRPWMINAHSLCHLEPLQNAALKFTKVQNAAVNYSSPRLVPQAGAEEVARRVGWSGGACHSFLMRWFAQIWSQISQISTRIWTKANMSSQGSFQNEGNAWGERSGCTRGRTLGPSGLCSGSA